jgi:Tfp pilus assembly protein PilV
MRTNLDSSYSKSPVLRPGLRGYTLIEALIATSILMLGALAAASLSLTMAKQDDLVDRTAQAVNWHENAAELYRLGLSSAEIAAIIPPPSFTITRTLTEATENVTNLGNVTIATSSITYKPDPDAAATETRTHVLKVLRPLHQ